MADVNIQQSPSTETGRGSGAVWAVVAVVLIFLLAWFFFFRGGNDSAGTGDAQGTVQTPAGGASGSGGTGGGGTGGSGTTTPPPQ